MKVLSLLFWVFLVFVSCDERSNRNLSPDFYRTFSHANSELPKNEIGYVVREFRKISRPSIPGTEDVFGHWMMAEDARAPRVTISLPHKFSEPDREMWYYSHCRLESPGIIRVIADDGAQLFISGKRIHAQGNFFPIPDTGHFELAVRVINNAMSGGLISVTFCPENLFRIYEKELNDYRRLKTIVAKFEKARISSAQTLQMVKEAVKDPSDQTITGAESGFSSDPLLIGPVVQFIDDNNIVISVVTEKKDSIKLAWGTADESSLSNELIEEGPVALFRIQIPSDATTLYYSVRCRNSTLPVSVVKISKTDKFSFNVWADSQSGWEAFEKNMLNNTRHDDVFGIGVGDLVGTGWDEEEWLTLLNLLSIDAREKAYFLIPGNHDYDGYYDSLVSRNYHRFTKRARPYYSWRYRNCAFIALDPNLNFPIGVPGLSKQYEWLMDEMHKESWKTATWKFILLHQPPFSQGWEGYHGDSVLRELLEPLIEQHQIDFVISGHTHDYERLTRNYGHQKVTFIIVGGAGGSLEPPPSSDHPVMDTVIKTHHIGRFFIDGDAALFNVFDLQNNVIDSVRFVKNTSMDF